MDGTILNTSTSENTYQQVQQMPMEQIPTQATQQQMLPPQPQQQYVQPSQQNSMPHARQPLPTYPQFPVQQVPATPFFETKFGKYIKQHVVLLLAMFFLDVALLLLFAPLFNGENYYFFAGTGKMYWLYFFLLIYLCIYGLLVIDTLGYMKKFPRILNTLITSFYSFILGGFLMLFTVWSAASSISNYASTGYTIEFPFYLVMILVFLSYLAYVFNKQISQLIKIS